MTCTNEILVRINMDCAHRGMELLTPGGSLRWENIRFDVNPEEGGHADFAVVLGNARPRDSCMVAPENTLFIAGEPLSKKLYPSGLLPGSSAQWWTAMPNRITRIFSLVPWG